jgi:hypothetical protein
MSNPESTDGVVLTMKLREFLVGLCAILATCLRDTPETLKMEARAGVLRQRIEDCRCLIAQLDEISPKWENLS